MEFAVIRGQQRNTTFYQANIPFGDIARNVDLLRKYWVTTCLTNKTRCNS